MKSSKCRACGREIVWAKSPNGKATPYEPVKNLHSIEWGMTDWHATPREPDVQVYLSHFVHCPNANEFSKTNVKPQLPLMARRDHGEAEENA